MSGPFSILGLWVHALQAGTRHWWVDHSVSWVFGVTPYRPAQGIGEWTIQYLGSLGSRLTGRHKALVSGPFSILGLWVHALQAGTRHWWVDHSVSWVFGFTPYRPAQGIGEWTIQYLGSLGSRLTGRHKALVSGPFSILGLWVHALQAGTRHWWVDHSVSWVFGVTPYRPAQGIGEWTIQYLADRPYLCAWENTPIVLLCNFCAVTFAPPCTFIPCTFTPCTFTPCTFTPCTFPPCTFTPCTFTSLPVPFPLFLSPLYLYFPPCTFSPCTFTSLPVPFPLYLYFPLYLSPLYLYFPPCTFTPCTFTPCTFTLPCTFPPCTFTFPPVPFPPVPLPPVLLPTVPLPPVPLPPVPFACTTPVPPAPIPLCTMPFAPCDFALDGFSPLHCWTLLPCLLTPNHIYGTCTKLRITAFISILVVYPWTANEWYSFVGTDQWVKV